MRYRFTLLFVAFGMALLADIILGSVNIPLSEIWGTLTGHEGNEIYREIANSQLNQKSLTED